MNLEEDDMERPRASKRQKTYEEINERMGALEQVCLDLLDRLQTRGFVPAADFLLEWPETSFVDKRAETEYHLAKEEALKIHRLMSMPHNAEQRSVLVSMQKDVTYRKSRALVAERRGWVYVASLDKEKFHGLGAEGEELLKKADKEFRKELKVAMMGATAWLGVSNPTQYTLPPPYGLTPYATPSALAAQAMPPGLPGWTSSEREEV